MTAAAPRTQAEADFHRRHAARRVIRSFWYGVSARTLLAAEVREVLAEAATLLEEAHVDVRGVPLKVILVEQKERPVMLRIEIPSIEHTVRVYLSKSTIQTHDGSDCATWDEESLSFKPVDENLEYAVEGVLKVALAELDRVIRSIT